MARSHMFRLMANKCPLWTIRVIGSVVLIGLSLALLPSSSLAAPLPDGSPREAGLVTAVSHPAQSTVAAASERPHGEPDATSAHSPPAKAEAVSLSGWFTVVWNDRPHYFLADDQGRWTELLLDEETAKPFGGPLTFNRQHVKIVGKRVTAPAGAVRVLSIALE